jgi:hypothetical protein
MSKQDYIDFLELENDALHLHIAKLEEIISDIVNNTFEGNTSLDTVVIQKYGCPPVIYKNGVLKGTKNASAVSLIFKTNEEYDWEPTNLVIEEGM